MPYIVIDTPVGKISVVQTGQSISHVLFGERKFEDVLQETPLLAQAKEQLISYFMGERKQFDLPIDPVGTPFQMQVWQALCQIPYGTTISYGQLAKNIGNPKAVRAVGGANNKNPIAILVPCHRVIGANGTLVGYGGGLDMKEYLLALEKIENK